MHAEHSRIIAFMGQKTGAAGRRSWFHFVGLLLLTALLCLDSSAVQASSPARWADLADTLFQNYSKEDGLPNSIVTALAEDGDGFLWVGTQGGLARWDGYRFRNYKPDAGNAGALPASRVMALHTDRAGTLWVGTTGGLARYDRALDRFILTATAPDAAARPQVRALADDDDGGLWVGTDDGLDHLDKDGAPRAATRQNDQSGLPAGAVQAILRDHAGILWVGTETGLARRDAGTERFVTIAFPGLQENGPPILSLFEDQADQIWIGTDGHGVFGLGDDRQSPLAVTEDNAPGAPLQHEAIVAITATDNELWLATSGSGIVIRNFATGRTRRIHHDATLPSSLAHSRLLSMLRDRAGSIWVGGIGGLSRLISDQGGVLTLFGGTNRAGTLTEPDLYSLLPRDDGTIWMGFISGGVDILDPASGKIETLRADPSQPQTALPATAVLGMTAGGNAVFIATARGLYRWDPPGIVQRLTLPRRAPGERVNAVLANQGMVWIGGQSDGLRSLPISTGTLPQSTPPAAGQLTDPQVRSLLVTDGANLWAGTLKGINRLNLVTGALERIPSDSTDPEALAGGMTSSMLVDRQGRLWVSSLGGGIAVLTHRDPDGRPRFHRLGIKDGLPDSNVDKLLQDNDGKIWASTDSGLARIDPDDFAIHGLDRADGLAISNYWANSGCLTAEGDLLFGGQGGLTIVRPPLIKSWDYHPPVVVTEARIGGKPVPVGRFNGAGSTLPLMVTPAANAVAIEFAALDYTAPERNRYEYRLQGYDRDWIATDATRRLASYTNLPPGDYSLSLRGSNRDGLWSEMSFSLPIRVLPAWYQSWWFKLLLAVAAIIGVAALVQTRTAQLRQRQRELQRLVDERTATLERKSKQVRTLLDNSGEGFLSFAADLRVAADYSAECRRLFEQDIAGQPLESLLYGDDAAQADYLRLNLSRVFEIGPETARAETYLKLLPADYQLQGRFLEARYKAVGDNRLMLILTDVSDEKALQDDILAEQRRIAFIVNAVEKRNDLLDTLEGWQGFLSDRLPWLLTDHGAAMSPGAVLTELHREIHTYKGLFAQDQFPTLPAALHHLEDRLATVIKAGDITPGSLRQTIAACDLATPLAADLAQISTALGANFLAAGKLIEISAEVIDRLETDAAAVVDSRTEPGKKLLASIRALRLRRLSSLLEPHFAATLQLATRLDKELAPIRYEGDDPLVDPRHFTAFCKSLVHVFRNCADHGLDDAEARFAAGKDELGHIHCRGLWQDGALLLCIGDDGRGIDSDLMRRRAVEKGTISAEDAAKLPEQSAFRLIFVDGLSSRDSVTDISGRGVGLAATLAALDRLGGRVEIASAAGVGTDFRFALPLL